MTEIRIQKLHKWRDYPESSDKNQEATMSDDHYSPSIADELRKLADLSSEGVLTEPDFEHIKKEIIIEMNKT